MKLFLVWPGTYVEKGLRTVERVGFAAHVPLCGSKLSCLRDPVLTPGGQPQDTLLSGNFVIHPSVTTLSGTQFTATNSLPNTFLGVSTCGQVPLGGLCIKVMPLMLPLVISSSG